MLGGVVKRHSTPLPSQPQQAATSKCPKWQWKQQLLSPARQGTVGCRERVRRERWACPPPPNFFIVLQLPAGFGVIPSKFSASPLVFFFVLFLIVKCITEKSEVSEYWAFMTPRTFAFKQPEPRQTEASHIYY